MKKIFKYLIIASIIFSFSGVVFARKYFGVIPYYVTHKANGSKVEFMLIEEEGVGYTSFNYSMVDRYVIKKSEDECLKFITHSFCDNIAIFDQDFVLKWLYFKRQFC